MNTQITTIIKETGLEPTKADVIIKSFTGFLEQTKEWEAKAKAIVITDISQTKEMRDAREARLALKSIRVNAENVRKELKEQSLREGKAIDGIANVIKALIVPIEEHLEKQEKFVEVQEEARKEKVNAERIVKLSAFIPDTSIYNLKEMSDEAFEKLLETSKIASEAVLAAEKKAEQERVAQEKAQAEEQKRIKLENEKLKKEAEAREKALAKERAEQEKKLEVERAKARAEAEAREKAEAELEAKRQAEEGKRLVELKQAEEDKQRAKDERYKTFLKENGYSTNTKHLFHIEKVGNEVRLFKVVAIFNIN